MYEKILSDDEYRNMMDTISTFHFIEDGKWDWEHGIGHAVRVSKYVEKILTSLHASKREVELGRIAALLHDIGLLTGEKKGHAKRSAFYAEKYLSKYRLKEKERTHILEAIRYHSNGEKITSKIGAALLLADKLDIGRERVENSIIHDEMNAEILKIERVDVEITNDDICIFYKTQRDFQPSIFQFWNKPLTIPPIVSAYYHKKCIFKWNHQIFDVESVVAKACKEICL